MSDAIGATDHDERLLSGYTGRLSVAIALGWLGVNLGQRVLPPLLPRLIDELSITPSEAGFALTLLVGVHAVLLYPGGRLSDRLSRTTVLVAGLGTMVVGFAVLATVASTYLALLCSVALIGIGYGLYSIPSRAFLSDLFVKQRGRAFGIFQAAGGVGSALGAGVAVAALAVATWQAAFLPVVAVLVAVVVLLHTWSREPYVVERVDLEVRETVGRVFWTPRFRWFVVSYTAFQLTWQGVFGFLPTFLQAEKGLSPALASAGFAAPFVIGIVVNPVAGAISDRVTRGPIAGGALLVAALGLAVVVAAPSRLLIAAGIVVFAVGLMAFPPVMQAFLMDAFPDGSMGGDFGAFKTVYSAIGSLGPAYVGFVAERASYGAAFGGLVGCLFAGAGVILWLGRR